MVWSFSIWLLRKRENEKLMSYTNRKIAFDEGNNINKSSDTTKILLLHACYNFSITLFIKFTSFVTCFIIFQKLYYLFSFQRYVVFKSFFPRSMKQFLKPSYNVILFNQHISVKYFSEDVIKLLRHKNETYVLD